MKITAWQYLVAFLFVTLMQPLLAAQEQATYTPERWWPSEWGDGDQLGALNRLDANKVLRAASLIQQGVNVQANLNVGR